MPSFYDWRWLLTRTKSSYLKLCSTVVLALLYSSFGVQVVPGQNTEAFKRYPYPKLANYSFSLIYKVDGDTRTLDLTCKDEEQFETWFNGIQVICSTSCCRSHKQRHAEVLAAWVVSTLRALAGHGVCLQNPDRKPAC